MVLASHKGFGERVLRVLFPIRSMKCARVLFFFFFISLLCEWRKMNKKIKVTSINIWKSNEEKKNKQKSISLASAPLSLSTIARKTACLHVKISNILYVSAIRWMFDEFSTAKNVERFSMKQFTSFHRILYIFRTSFQHVLYTYSAHIQGV